MGIPDFQTLMLPFLRAVHDKRQHSISELYKALSDEFELSSEERERLLPSGRETIIKNRIAWARTYLKKAGLVASPSKGMVAITSRGLRVLESSPVRIDNVFLRQFKEFEEFRPRVAKEIGDTEPADELQTPEESLGAAYQRLKARLASDLLDSVKQSGPEFFEQLVVDLMIALGYGGSRKDAGNATQRSRDGGIDGVIREDRLGLDAIYLQAKCYGKDPIREPQVRDFAGALQATRAKKGVFITTTSFTEDARQFVKKIDNKIILVDGEMLVDLMIEHDVGVVTKETYKIKQVDSEYFTEE